MKLNNIEKQIKEKLQSREIQPSDMAWDRLDAMLSVAEEKKTKRSFGWLYIAASILVFVGVGTFFFNQNTSEITPNTTIVNQEVIKDSISNSLEKIQNEVPVEKMQPIVQVEENTNQSETDNRQPTTNNQQPSTKPRVSIIKSNQSVAQKSTPNQQKNSPIQNQEVIAENKVTNESNNPTPVFSSPLNSENKEVIALNELNQKPSKVTVSANSLLSQVDGELELTFREKVFKTVSKNYKEVKVAVTNRNNLD
jgi:hypothetical protein